MLKHDWMRKRDRRTRRLGEDGLAEQDESLFDDEEPLADAPELGGDEEAALEQEPWLPEEPLPAADLDEDAGVEAAVDDEPDVAQFAAEDEDTGATGPVWPEEVAVDDEDDVVSEPDWDPDEAAAENLAPVDVTATRAPAQAVAEPAHDEVRAVLDGLDLPVQTLRDRLEQVLARQAQLPLDIEARQEVSEKAESSPRERRDELVQRLLDPTLNLHEAAVLLGVCRTTVRRYTDRGLLRCFRTPGNQRRFNLSDILDFMERQQRGEV